MKKLNNSNFELIEDIIKTIDLKYDGTLQKNIECLEEFWEEIVGEKISKISRVYDILKDNSVVVVCSDSFIANELYLEKDKLLNDMNYKTEKLGIKIKDIKFDYKKWKEKNNEQKI